MKRHLLFKESETSYLIEENQQDIFDISKSDLKFDSLKFYNNIFKNAAGYQEILLLKEESSFSKNASYICVWISEIIENICTALNEGLEAPIDEEETILELPVKVIKLYTLSACAGDGIYVGDSDNDSVDIEVENQDANYAVKISGHSMEPDIPDNSIVLVKEQEKLMQGDIGIFNINGESMCKQYTESNGKVILCPINDQFETIEVKDHSAFHIQGKVIEIMS